MAIDLWLYSHHDVSVQQHIAQHKYSTSYTHHCISDTDDVVLYPSVTIAKTLIADLPLFRLHRGLRIVAESTQKFKYYHIKLALRTYPTSHPAACCSKERSSNY